MHVNVHVTMYVTMYVTVYVTVYVTAYVAISHFWKVVVEKCLRNKWCILCSLIVRLSCVQ